MKALKKKSNRLFQFHVLKCVNCFLLVWYSKVIYFFSIGRKEKKCLIYQWWKSWLVLVLDEIFMLPLELRLEALCFQAIPPSVPFSQLWYLLRNFRFDPIVHLDSRKTNEISIQHFIFKEVTGQLPRDVTMLPKPSTLQIIIHHHSCRDCVPNWRLEGY